LIVPIFILLANYGLDLSTREIRISLMIFCSVAAIIGGAGFVTWLFTGAYRVMYTWPVGAQNRGAAFLGLFLPHALVSLIDAFRYRKNRLIWLTIFSGLLGGILASQTRSILLTLFPVVFYISRHDRYAMRFLMVILLIALATIPSLLITRMAFFFGQGEVDWSSVGRIQIWLNSLEMLPKYFWTGMGISSFKQIYSVTYPYAFIKAIHPHNIYLQLIFDYGIFGLIGHLWLFFGGLWIGHKAMKQGLTTGLHDEARTILGLNAGLICILIAGLTDSFLTGLRVAFAFWIIFAYMLVLSRRIRSSTVSG
jgi:O-antigen ligase